MTTPVKKIACHSKYHIVQYEKEGGKGNPKIDVYFEGAIQKSPKPKKPTDHLREIADQVDVRWQRKNGANKIVRTLGKDIIRVLIEDEVEFLDYKIFLYQENKVFVFKKGDIIEDEIEIVDKTTEHLKKIAPILDFRASKNKKDELELVRKIIKQVKKINYEMQKKTFS